MFHTPPPPRDSAVNRGSKMAISRKRLCAEMAYPEPKRLKQVETPRRKILRRKRQREEEEHGSGNVLKCHRGISEIVTRKSVLAAGGVMNLSDVVKVDVMQAASLRSTLPSVPRLSVVSATGGGILVPWKAVGTKQGSSSRKDEPCETQELENVFGHCTQVEHTPVIDKGKLYAWNGDEEGLLDEDGVLSFVTPGIYQEMMQQENMKLRPQEANIQCCMDVDCEMGAAHA